MTSSAPTAPFPTPHAGLNAWVDECARLCRPGRVVWCDGSDAEHERLIGEMLAKGTLHKLNQTVHPGCFLHRSHPNDVARVEDRTFICTPRRDDAGPTNNWMAPAEAKAILNGLFDGCMAGRTLYVVPYVMGPLGSPFARVGVEITDSPYVVASMRIMTRIGTAAFDQLGTSGAFVPGLHSFGNLDPARRYICHFPDEPLIASYGSNYGGNALLGKKCFALRIASRLARDEGWMAEHMLILELTDPAGERTYFAGAFPSACGKTNLAMLVSPLSGWSIRTIGDDIAWMHVGPDGRLWAINPEAGFFGVAPGTSVKTNPNAVATMRTNTIYTNVAVSDDGLPWWEGGDGPAPDPLTDWHGVRCSPEPAGPPAAHPNSRFTALARQNPGQSPHWEDPAGVPISGIFFGGRRSGAMPLVVQARDWQHGVFLGATMASETTAAATGRTGVLRRDPFAMLPFCGYHMGDYFAHWLDMGRRIPHPPALFHVNWFRRDAQGNYLWPGYGENVRALIWMLGRIRGTAATAETPIGYVPTPESLNLSGLDLPRERLEQLLTVDKTEWRAELPSLAEHFATFGERLPAELDAELGALRERLV